MRSCGCLIFPCPERRTRDAKRAWSRSNRCFCSTVPSWSGGPGHWLPVSSRTPRTTLAADSNYARQLNSGIDPNTVKDYLLDVDHPVVVPVDTKVRLLLTGNDVIHSWWVPDFAVKKDAIPGFIKRLRIIWKKSALMSKGLEGFSQATSPFEK